MEYQYNAGESENYPARMGVERWFSAEVDPETGTFSVPEDHDRFDEIQARLEELGHTPVNADTDDTYPLEGLTEDDIVGMGYDALRSLASDCDDVDGRMSKEKIQEALILKVRGDA